ncbi:uncharacterized protein LOC144634183 isoform X2 [Oculina patagonica]
MPGAVDVLQQFANDDLFDAELGEDSDGGQNGDRSDDENASNSPSRDWLDKENEDNSNEEAANSGSDGETFPDKKKKQKKRESRKKSPKPRKAKKTELMSMYSETQRMVRESIVRLPYHQPTVLPISHFLKRVPITDQKKADRKPLVETSASPPESQILPPSDDAPDDLKLTSPVPGDTASPTGVVNGVKETIKAATPKLSAATDPFFLDMDATPTLSKPANNKGVQSLMERFMKHASKPKEKSVTPVRSTEAKDNQTEDANTEGTPKPRGVTPVVSDDKLKAATPGSRLQLLKEQLQKQMKVKRAEVRKIQESQRKLDNEEMSEEEEEDMTDEEDDSDYELDKWNEVDERKQEEGESDLEEEEPKDKNAFIEEEADESDNGDDDNGRYDIDSGSEGDISDGGESDNSDDGNSVFSDDGLAATTSNRKLKKKQKKSRQTAVNLEEKTMDLFADSRSKGGVTDEPLLKDSNAEKDSGESMASLCLRLDSVEDGDDTNFNFPSLPATKLKTKLKGEKNLTNISEVSQESSQSSFGTGFASEFGESANSLEASSDSSRIPPGQGDNNNAQGNEDRSDGKKTPEMFSSFSRLRNLIGMTSDGDTQSAKKPGKLSQLTLPIEDSQDLFDHETDRNVDENNSEQDRSRPEAMSNDFHFSLDEDTQFTQILNTQGFLNSSKKSKPKTKKLFDDDMDSNTQPQMKELLGLCSGRFSDSEDSRTAKNNETQDNANKHQKEFMFETQSKQFNMNELLGLCSGKFTDDDNEIEDDITKSREKDSEKSESELGEQEDKSDDEDDDKILDKESDDGEESDPEEMIIKRKYGKTYEAKKSNVFDKRNFLEEEAELSGSDVGSDEDEDIATDDDMLEEDSGGEELPSDEELQKQINKVHMKSIHDQDNADLRAVKEMFLPDGELYTDGQGRTRHFRWRGIDENSQFELFGNKGLWGDEEGEAVELSTEEEIQRRKERYEREAFLREEMGKQEADILDIDESSQIILNKIKDTSSQLTEAPVKPQAIVNPKSTVHVAPVMKKKTSFKGSFLKYSKTTLSRLSSLTSNTPNASATTRGFVFQTVSPSSKNNSNAKKMQRTHSVIEQPASKKPRLDRSLSDSNSVFSML